MDRKSVNCDLELTSMHSTFNHFKVQITLSNMGQSQTMGVLSLRGKSPNSIR